MDRDDDSALTGPPDTDGISGTTITNIYGNGHTASAIKALPQTVPLGGKRYSLADEGTLVPA